MSREGRGGGLSSERGQGGVRGRARGVVGPALGAEGSRLWWPAVEHHVMAERVEEAHAVGCGCPAVGGEPGVQAGGEVALGRLGQQRHEVVLGEVLEATVVL